jgi:hypothetical protein
MSPRFSLAEAQSCVARTIEDGPAALPAALFAGVPEHVLRGLKVHANTISHARLVALEDTFPRTRALIGEAAFNTLSRDYLDSGNGCDQSLDNLGRDFPDWLQANAIAQGCVTLARFEWLWLTSYHAPDATPLTPSLFTGASLAEVLDLRITPHPAAHLMPNDTDIASIICLEKTGAFLLIARPDAEVVVYAVTDTTASLFEAFTTSHNLAAAFETFLARHANDSPLDAMQFLLAAGALREGRTPMLSLIRRFDGLFARIPEAGLLLFVRVVAAHVFWVAGETRRAEGTWFGLKDGQVDLFRDEFHMPFPQIMAPPFVHPALHPVDP